MKLEKRGEVYGYIQFWESGTGDGFEEKGGIFVPEHELVLAYERAKPEMVFLKSQTPFGLDGFGPLYELQQGLFNESVLTFGELKPKYKGRGTPSKILTILSSGLPSRAQERTNRVAACLGLPLK